MRHFHGVRRLEYSNSAINFMSFIANASLSSRSDSNFSTSNDDGGDVFSSVPAIIGVDDDPSSSKGDEEEEEEDDDDDVARTTTRERR